MLRPRTSTSGGQSAGGDSSATAAEVVFDDGVVSEVEELAVCFLVIATQEAKEVQERHLALGVRKRLER